MPKPLNGTSAAVSTGRPEPPAKRRQVAEREARARHAASARRGATAHRPEPRRRRRLASRHLGHAVDPRRCARRPRRRRPAPARQRRRRRHRRRRRSCGSRCSGRARRPARPRPRRGWAGDCARSRSSAAISMPGVQMPHWAAPWARKDFCSASARRCRRRGPRPSRPAGRRPGPWPPGRRRPAAVEQHRAGAAVAGVAADLGAGETEIVAQRRRQPRDGGPFHGGRRPFRVKATFMARSPPAGGAAG